MPFILTDDGGHILTDSGGALIFDAESITTADTRWHLRPGGKTMSWSPIASISDEPIVVIVKGDDFQGGVVDSSAATGEIAVALPDVHPSSWTTGSWKTDATTSPPTYRLLGPSPLDLTLTQGLDYSVWVRLTDSAGVTIRVVSGLLSIV